MNQIKIIVLLIITAVYSCDPNYNTRALNKMQSPVVVVAISKGESIIPCAFVRDANGDFFHIEDMALQSLSKGDTIK